MNYIGNKYRIMGQIQKWFPRKIDTMVDLFCGGCDVTINTDAQTHYANDINYHVIDIFTEFQKYSTDYILGYIDGTIDKWHLSKTDAEAYNMVEFIQQTLNRDIQLYLSTVVNLEFHHMTLYLLKLLEIPTLIHCVRRQTACNNLCRKYHFNVT